MLGIRAHGPGGWGTSSGGGAGGGGSGDGGRGSCRGRHSGTMGDGIMVARVEPPRHGERSEAIHHRRRRGWLRLRLARTMMRAGDGGGKAAPPRPYRACVCGGGGRDGVLLLIQRRKAAKLTFREMSAKPPSAMRHELRPLACDSPTESAPAWIACMSEPDFQTRGAPTEAGCPFRGVSRVKRVSWSRHSKESRGPEIRSKTVKWVSWTRTLVCVRCACQKMANHLRS
jgi:hypothetical protein